jgi:PDZ domain-containing secreted protein
MRVSNPSDDQASSTSPETETAGDQPVITDPQRRPGWLALSMLLLVLCTSGIVAMLSADSGRVLLTPGPTYEVRYSGEAPDEIRPKSGWWMTTISVTRLNWAEATWREITGDPDVLTTTGAVGQGASTQMLSAKQTAALVVEAMLIGTKPDQQLVVIDVVPNTAAARIGLQVGDRLISIDGVNATGPEAISVALSDGGSELVYLRDTEVRSASLQGLDLVDGRLGVRLVGIGATAMIDGELIDTDDVGGASGGLMFSLSLIDAFTEGDLTNGRRISGTGQVTADGAVRGIVGAKYKYRAASAKQYDVFFVPKRNASEVIRTGRTRVVEVASVTEALRWLCENGGESSLCPPQDKTHTAGSMPTPQVGER